MAALDSAVSDLDAASALRLAAHQYKQLLVAADISSFTTAAATACRVFSHMLEAGACPSEATITSFTRVAASNPTAADEAFELVATMKGKYGLAPAPPLLQPRVRSVPAHPGGDKAYAVEAHMAASDVTPEEPELVALLDVSAKAGDADKVYEYMHKLRRAVDFVSEETAYVLEGWFQGKRVAIAGQAEWDADQVKGAIVANGGGSHRLGWLGIGPWRMQRLRIEADGECGRCRCQLACVDIDMEETHRFADSVAGLALERETKTNLNLFQEWLEAHKEYEAIVVGANIALYQQKFAEGDFSLIQSNWMVL